MKKLFLTILFILTATNIYPSPDNSISVAPVAVTGAKITAADENTRNGVISSAYNAHDHTDISKTANILNIGDGVAGDKTIKANNADVAKPFLKYEDATNNWIISSNGVAPSLVLSGSSLVFEGSVDDAYETTLDITNPTADRTQTFQNDSGVIPLGTAGNTLKLTTTAATDVTLPTSGTLTTTATTLQSVYPVGSIYISTSSTNPGTTFGFGTWVAYGEGRVLVSKAASGTFNTVNATGGVETVTLTAAQSGLPAHYHTFPLDSSTTPESSGRALNTDGAGADANGNTGSVASANASESHTNLQPYIVCYMWERTA